MDTTNVSDPLQQLEAANKTPIADLGPELSDLPSRSVRGVVTITWPYSSVKGTFSFILAEPDYRLRRNKGQVRINLNGAAAKAAGESGLSSSDQVLVSLGGVEWEPEETKKRQSLPGAGIDWQLKISDKLLLQVILAETGETKLISVDHSLPPPEPQQRVATPPADIGRVEDTTTQTLEELTPPSKSLIAKFKDGEYESPAFVKRARMSYGSLFEDGYDIFEDDGGVKGRGRKRTRFGRESGAWKYSSQSPSPEPASPPSRASSSPKPGMTDEGCQTMEIDYFPMELPVPTASFADGVPHSSEPIQSEEHVVHSQHGMVDHGIQGGFDSGWPAPIPTILPPFNPSGVLPSSGAEMPAFQHVHQENDVDDDLQGWDPNLKPIDPPPEGYPPPTEPPPPRPETTAYPPLEPEDEERPISDSSRDHIHYPPSYLEDTHPFSQGQAMEVEHDAFVPEIPTTTSVEPSSWATVNNPSQATAVPHIERFGSAEGDSVENAVVIDESDSDGEPPPPTAAEDTVMSGRADTLEMYEDAEVEDEVDAEYSDDDEPEYDADEMGGDYDTRIYEAPDDDEDDSHDEDLQSHNLEPEFDDGASWEGEGEDAENPDYDSEYDMDEEEEPERPSRTISQSAPQVIDLISSSEGEDEDEDDDESPQPGPSSQVPPRSTYRSPLGMAPPAQAIGPGYSSGGQEEGSEDGEDHEDNYDEEEEEEEEDGHKNDAQSQRSFDGPDSPSPTNNNEGIQSTLEGRGEVKVISDTGDEEEANVPQSAAEGLEILSRTVEGESNANRLAKPEEMQDEEIVDVPSPKVTESTVEHEQIQESVDDELQDAQDDEESVDMVSTVPDAAPEQRHVALDEKKHVETVAPSSPPMTQSFASQAANERKIDLESPTITGPHSQENQLPTPRDTQLVGDIAILDPVTVISMEVDEPDEVNSTEHNTMMDHEESPAIAQLVAVEPTSVVVEDIAEQIEERLIETIPFERQEVPLKDTKEITQHDNLPVSPSISFQTQLDADDMAQTSFTESGHKISIEIETNDDIHSDNEADVSGASISFRSQMEVDEELQASILEYSQDFGSVNTEVTEEYEIGSEPQGREDEIPMEVEPSLKAFRDPSPDLGSQEEERQVSQGPVSTIAQTDMSESSEIDASAQLARAANKSKRNGRQHGVAKNMHAEMRSIPTSVTPTPSLEDSSVQLARASLNKQAQGEEESSSMVAIKRKLTRYLRDQLPDCTQLKILRQHIQKKLDVIAVAMMQPPDPQRAKGGPREFMMSFTITDNSIGPFKVAEVQIYRPHIETLPIVKAGDVVLLRNFKVVSLQGKEFGLRTTDESSWAVFDHEDQPAQIKGPPVEYGEKETTYVALLRAWFNMLDEMARVKLERANKKIIDAGKSK
ncbi:uncharacterized protein F4822DRAFT_171114 [Hypoxylon trugodes]|uniref:uncharacterized protein n=1 Tax=Hypoxylon trugodes TaxID=326681 RepID=UPI0021981D57|nr:uncharacterized protein F4822DRAFT_171114 [Hypoxylon trugodes]KAI1391049.1 hypothetical protein F4822DRAFT_171114 [Hypoxylon trugodes]